MFAVSNPSLQHPLSMKFPWEKELQLSPEDEEILCAVDFCDLFEKDSLMGSELTEDVMTISPLFAHQNSTTASSTESSDKSSTQGETTKVSATKKKSKTTDKPGQKKRSRKKLTPEERLKISRDRNREHARRTRLKKKAYLEELRKKVIELQEKSPEQDSVSEPMSPVSGETAQSIRAQTLKNLLTLRASAEDSRNEWLNVVDENVCFIQPHSPFNQQIFSGSDACRMTLTGADSLISDTQIFIMLSHHMTACCGMNVDIEFVVDDSSVMHANDSVIARWNLVARSGATSMTLASGLTQAEFTLASKISKVEMFYDVLSMVSQVKNFIATSTPVFGSPVSVVHNPLVMNPYNVMKPLVQPFSAGL